MEEKIVESESEMPVGGIVALVVPQTHIVAGLSEDGRQKRRFPDASNFKSIISHYAE